MANVATDVCWLTGGMRVKVDEAQCKTAGELRIYHTRQFQTLAQSGGNVAGINNKTVYKIEDPQSHLVRLEAADTTTSVAEISAQDLCESARWTKHSSENYLA